MMLSTAEKSITSTNTGYPLVLENCGVETLLIISRGHHDLDVFKKHVYQSYEHYGEFFECAYHAYYKAVPSQLGTNYAVVGPTTRGAFPVTVAQEGWLKAFGLEEWNRILFKNGEVVVPLHDEYGPYPPVETCYGVAMQGESFLTVITEEGRPRKYNRDTAQYRIANANERAVGYRLDQE